MIFGGRRPTLPDDHKRRVLFYRIQAAKEDPGIFGPGFGEKFGEDCRADTARLIRQDKNITIPVIAEKLGLTPRAIEKQMVKLQASGCIRRVGPDKGGYWEIISEEKTS
ncbi:MAG: HTH domain-containing protein [Candidatus Omnitrophica bacterium]|nr:HTH domain-containing protein [Candidatus Omnitrophota bacterium]